MPSVRVLIIDHTAELAGGEVALARLLHALDRENYDPWVLLLADGPLAERLRDDGIRVALLPTSEQLRAVGRTEAGASLMALILNVVRTLSLIPRLTSAIRGAHADLVVANTLKSAVLTAIAAPLAGRRWVWHLHDRIAPDYLPRPMVFALRVLGHFAPRVIVANSHATRATLAGVPDNRVVVAYPGIDVLAKQPQRRATNTLSFGLLGRVAPTKGQLEFIRAAALLKEDVPEATFTIIGDAMFNDAAFAAQLRTVPAALGIADSVVFTGWMTDPIDAIAGLTALVHASPVPEPFGQVIIEAMLAGVPVIAANAGGVPEILDPDGLGIGVARGVIQTPLGLLVTPGDPAALASAMAWSAEHPRECTEMADSSRKRAAERFDIRRSARRVEQAWTGALRPASTAPPSAIVNERSATYRGAT